ATSHGVGTSTLKNCDAAELPAAEQFHKGAGFSLKLRQPVQVAARKFLPRIEVAEPARKTLIFYINHGAVGPAARCVDRLAKRVGNVEVDPSKFPPADRKGPALVRRKSVGLTVANAAETGVEPVQNAIEKVSVKAVHVVN